MTCAQLKSQIQSLNTEIADLQAELQKAAPAEKPGIKAQITQKQNQLKSVNAQFVAEGCVPAPQPVPPGNLILEKMRCVKSSERNGESPYLLIFIGHKLPSPTSTVVKLYQPQWDNNFYAGSVVTPNITVGTGVDFDTLVMVALIDEDANHDFDGIWLTKVQNRMADEFGKACAQEPLLTAPQLEGQLIPQFSTALETFRTDDDAYQIRHLQMARGTSETLVISELVTGGGGRYELNFRLT